MPKGYPAVVAGMVALSLIGACTEPKAAPSAPGVTVETLRARPWAQPDVGAGMPCPVSTAVSQPDPELGPLLGTGPARPAGLRDGLLGVTPAHLGTWRDREWAGQKVLWAVDRAAAGPILLRGRQLDGPGRVAFDDPAVLEMVFGNDTYEGQPGGWMDHPGYTRVKTAGCYAYQVDSPTGTWSVVFRAELAG